MYFSSINNLVTNCFDSAQIILKLPKNQFTVKYLKEKILSYPHFPRLLTLYKVLEKYKLHLKIGKDKLDEVSLAMYSKVSIQGMDFLQPSSMRRTTILQGMINKG